MPDTDIQRGEQDAERIDLTQDEQLRRWAHELGVGPQRVREAVAAVGNDPGKVRAFLEDERSASARADQRAGRDEAAEAHSHSGATDTHGNDRPIDGGTLRVL